MKHLHLLAVSFATAVIASAIVYPAQQQPLTDFTAPEKYLVEFGPGDTQWITEDEKWSLKRVR